MNKKRLYFIKGTYPYKVTIQNQDKLEELIYDSEERFVFDIDKLFKMSNLGNVVRLYFDQSKCRVICFDNFFTKSGFCGMLNLKDFSSIRFYEYNEDADTEIFDDLFSKYLSSNDEKIKQVINKKCFYELSKDVTDFISNVFVDYFTLGIEGQLVPAKMLSEYFLSEKNLVNIIAKKYKLLDYIKCDRNEFNYTFDYDYDNNPNGHQFVVNIIYLLLYTINDVTKDINDVLQIVKKFVDLVDNEPIDKYELAYKALGDYLKNNYEINFITFSDIYKIIGFEADCRFWEYYYLLENYGFYVSQIDFNNKRVYYKIQY